MKISERLALLKAGYSKEEINSMIDEDQKAAEVPGVAEPKDDSGYMKVISALANEVKDLKEAVYSNNINNTEVKKTSVQSAEDMLAELFSAPKKED